MSKNWTDERKKRQAEKIREWQPWKKSTGPRTATGKKASAMRGYKGEMRKTLRELGRALNKQRRELDNIGT